MASSFDEANDWRNNTSQNSDRNSSDSHKDLLRLCCYLELCEIGKGIYRVNKFCVPWDIWIEKKLESALNDGRCGIMQAMGSMDENTIEITEKCTAEFIDLLLKHFVHSRNIHSKLRMRMHVQLKWKTFKRVGILLL
jgi:hypothetical protein